ncbi:unnamed protein product [Adineta steineri]|uniref:Uncharacterized protein n=2 Tax=Adineta steineri TaxID=433720 RepID=A0A814N391_9BILA|nr:unnamed protein product [Adineta steineri]CAF1137989.1 unnamed protein product [Adineta steineri]CAF3581392.1 unnamed protein product [Adineta steineri]CAF3618738.1 unnamed protein product [Adineta steineri]
MATCKYSFNALRRASSSSAAVASTASKKKAPQTKSGHYGIPQRVNLPKESINVTKLQNGLTVASMENNSPVFRVAAVVEAGAKYEPYDSRGVTTLLRVFSNMSTKYVSRLGLTKNLERLGANFKCVQTREQMIYSIEGLRSELTHGAQFLIPIVCYPMFKPHEIHDERERLEIDHKLYLQSPELQLNDLLHEAAFKGGLSRSLSICPDMMKKLSHKQMYTFHSHYYTPSRISLVGTGCNHATLVQLADKFRFSPLDCVYTPGFGNLKLIDSEPEPSKYKGGELRHDTQSSLVHIALACEGVSSKDEKGILTSSLLHEVLGNGPNIKWSAGSNRLQRAAQAVANSPCLVSSFNLHYTESGLFGVHIMCDKNDTDKVVKAVWNEFNKVLKNGISKDDVTVAKKKLQVNLQMTSEQSSDVFSKMISQPDISDRSTDVQSIVGSLEQGDYSHDSINQLAKKMLNGKQPTLVSIGNLNKMPYIDDLKA